MCWVMGGGEAVEQDSVQACYNPAEVQRNLATVPAEVQWKSSQNPFKSLFSVVSGIPRQGQKSRESGSNCPVSVRPHQAGTEGLQRFLPPKRSRFLKGL